jgi:hypothetical protein
MTLQKGPRMEVRSKSQMIFRLTLLSLLVLTMGVAGMASPQEAAQSAAQEQEVAPAGGVNEYEGVVKVGLGNFFYLPAAKGFDIYIQGTIEGRDASVLAGKEIKVKGSLLKEDPSVFVAESLDIKEAGQYRNVFTRTEEVVLKDHLSVRARQSFPTLNITSADKSQEWEGKGKVKIYGTLAKVKTADGKEGDAIAVTADEGKAVGKILVDAETDFARYYIKKLSLFNKFWFYITVKDTVDVKVRRKTREVFHADLIFAGLY